MEEMGVLPPWIAFLRDGSQVPEKDMPGLCKPTRGFDKNLGTLQRGRERIDSWEFSKENPLRKGR
jgi:hypothetical protein